MLEVQRIESLRVIEHPLDVTGLPFWKVMRLLEGIRGGAGFTDSVETAMLDHFMTDPAYTPPTTWYMGMSSTTPTDAGGNVTEPSGGNYARVGTVAADWSAASGTAPAVKTNTAVLTFGTASADWVAAANLTYFTMHTLVTAGAVGVFGAMATAKPVLNGDTASFAASSLTLQLGDPGDTY